MIWVRPEGRTAPPLVAPRAPLLLASAVAVDGGEDGLGFTWGMDFEARECHFSDGSASRRLVSAQRGCGLPMDTDEFWRGGGVTAHLPRNSLTRLSSSAILFRRRVHSSRDGSSLARARVGDKKHKGYELTLASGHRSHTRTDQSKPKVVRRLCFFKKTERRRRSPDRVVCISDKGVSCRTAGN